MSAGKIIGYIVSAIFLFFGVLYLWSAPVSDTGTRLFIGIVLVGIGLGIIVLIRIREPKPEQRIVHEVDLPGDTSLEQMRCRSCGGPLDKDSVSLVQGALTVTCPYCGSVYQVEEEPKW
jgi:hypothetical protein